MNATEIDRRPLPWIGGTLHRFVHEPTGAGFLHLECPVRDTFFNAVYRTLPSDSTGVAHITEHSVSGGSRRFPPGAGALMYRRSLVTDLNGMTSPDHTEYYFASPHEADVRNWIGYMVDGSLFMLKTEDTFLRQRGHLEHRVPDNPATPLRYTGVIYNEMKAVFAVPLRHASIALRRALFPGHPYAEDSGGIPRHIPELTYGDYLDFHARHYHPANAWYVSLGPSSPEAVQRAVLDCGIDEAAGRDPVAVPAVRPIAAPVTVHGPLPGSASPFGLLGWVPRADVDPGRRAALTVAADVLFGSAGHVWDLLRPLLAVELPGADAERGRDRLLARLEEVARSGADPAEVEGAVGRWERRRRDPAAARLSFMAAVMPELCRDGDPALAADVDAVAAAVREAAADGFRELVRSEFLDNPHQALAVMEPDPDLLAREEAFEAELVLRLASELSPAQRAAMVDDTDRILNPTLVTETPVECLDPRTAEVRPLPAGDARRPLVFPVGAQDEAVLEWLWLLPALFDGLEAELRFATDVTGDRCLAWLQLEAAKPRAVAVTPATLAEAARRRLTDLEQHLMDSAQPHLMRLAGARLRRHLALEHEALGFGALRRARAAARWDARELEAASERLRPALSRLLRPDRPLDAVSDETSCDGPRHVAATTPIPVAFNGVAWRLGGLADPLRAAAAAVLAQQMRYGHLTTEVGRKGQAYGVDAEADAEHGVLWVSSRRDPNIDSTFAAIDRAVAIAASGEISEREVEDSILSAYRATMPAPTAFEQARQDQLGELTGRTREVWDTYHAALRSVTVADVRSAAAELREGVRATLASGPASRMAGDLFDALEPV